ncbi:cell division control protein 6 homolog [Lucilia cuprina]|uniref:cell division control protein 6 homolog n=1 Tax=Lucilia cuprina TaxID=7375 RepID=UPI001F06D1C9|nr:cell division control protein 6 homolog [Lucilia cuprina]
MAAVRRSTRLSSIGKSTPTLPATPKTPKQASLWQHRNSRNSVTIHSDEEEEEERSSNCSNEENCDLINKMEQRKRTSARSKKTVEAEEIQTPKSKKSTKPMPASKKRELLKRLQSEEDVTADEEDSQKGSPPKQVRQQPSALPPHVISPSRLLDRLSIDEKPEEVSSPQISPKKEKVKETSPKTTPVRNKYQNARRVLNSAECQNLPGREEQLEELRSFLREHLEAKKSGSLYVSGQPGTGKTACLSLLLRTPEFNKRLQTVYVNCTSIASIGGVYKKLCAQLNLKPQGRTERDHLQALQHHIKSSPKMLLIVLDEIDQLCSSKQSVLYTIFEWPSMPDASILLVGIANSLDLTERTLLRLNARCELKPKHMHFPPYSKQQIVDIFKSRLAEADVLDIFPPVTLNLLAAKVSAVSGDVRRALDIGRRVVEIAEQQKKAGEKEINLKNLNLPEGKNPQPTNEEILKPVQVTQVAAVLNKVYGASQNLQEDMDEAFPLQQKIMLCSLMLMLRNEKNKDITMGRLHEVYRRVCNKRNIHPVDQAEFASLVDLVQTRGILRIVKKKEPRLSKVQLQWDEEEVNGALSDKQLIASILDDTACLGK